MSSDKIIFYIKKKREELLKGYPMVDKEMLLLVL